MITDEPRVLVPEMGAGERAEFYRTILESSTEYAIFASDREGAIVLWNDGARQIYGYEPAEVVGAASTSVLHHPDDLASGRDREILELVRRSGKWSGELRRIRKDGTGLSAFVTITLRRSESGEWIGFTSISRDLTEDQRMVRELSDTQEYNRGLIDSNIDPLMTTDALGNISDVNRQMCEMTGATREQLVGSPFELYFTDPQLARDGIRKVLSEDRVTNYELVMRSQLGHVTPVSYNATPFRDASGNLRGIFAFIRDITEQKRLEAEIRERTDATAFVNNVLESATVYSIVAMDLDGTVLAWNEGARRNYGYTADEMVGRQSARVLYAPEDLASGRVEQTMAAACETGAAEGVFERVRKDGHRFTASVALTLRRDAEGAPLGYVMISKDITEQKEMEQQLLRKNEELEAQNRRVVEANRLKSEFLANMSHELRTPLNGIIGFSELMHDGKVGPVSADHKEYLGDILTSSRHLLRLINDVLDLAKVESGTLQFWPEPVKLGALVGEVRDIVRTLGAEKRIRVVAEVDPSLDPIVADPAKLKQVLYNFLSNALKFTPEEGRVSVRALPEGDDRFRIEVEDSGIGIRPEDFGRLFVEFQQLDASAAKKYPGTGLGLALTRRIVEAQGGEVGVRSTVGVGSTFFAVLPRIASGPAPDPTIQSVAGLPGSPVVLVVEDNPRDRAWLVSTLTAAGYAVEAVASGEEAIRLAATRSFDAMTLDILLPDMTGWDVLRTIRASQRNADLPTIVVTVGGDPGTGLGFVIQDSLLKPVQGDDLLAALLRIRVLDGAELTLLVVDDDPNVAKLVEPAVRALGYRVIAVADAERALLIARETPPSAVILDLLMPGIGGFEFLHRFRLTEAGRLVPVIVWTVKDLTAGERARLQASAQAILAKGAGSTDAIVSELQRYLVRGAADVR